MDDDVDHIFNLPLADIIVKCPPEMTSYLSGALFRLNQSSSSFYGDMDGKDADLMLAGTQHPLNQSDDYGLMSTDWSSPMGSSAIPTPVGILRNHQEHSLSHQEDMQRLKYYSYGIALPTICVLGILGNVLNLICLKKMRGPAYIYMRGNHS